MWLDTTTLLITASTVGCLHALSGPDHYVPFIALSRAEKWSSTKTFGVTALCGLGHILSAVVLGLLGASFLKWAAFETWRGRWVAWALIAFGLVYFVIGLRRASRRRVDSPCDGKSLGTVPWMLFLLFVFGPCEPLIPLMLIPAAARDLVGVCLVASVFGLTTILTMLTVVFVTIKGLRFVPAGRWTRYTHALAGASLWLCGMGILFWGL